MARDKQIMVDYSKCDGRDCAVRSECVRYVSMPDPRTESWIDPSPRGAACQFLVRRRARVRMVDVSTYSREHVAGKKRIREPEVSG